MSDRPLTPDRFNRHIRDTLRFQHDFGHHDLNRAERIVSAAIEHTSGKRNTSGLYGKHYGDVEKFLNMPTSKRGSLSDEHREVLKEWRRMPSHQRDAVLGSLKGHFGLEEPTHTPPPESANENKAEDHKAA
jgi:hypothetical protein